MKKLTVITINYNNLEGLKRTMRSVLNQIWKEFEYIVIDGGSTDGSAEYLESQSDKIDYWVSEPDNGIYHAMNKGILKSSGEYLLFLNSGDHFYSDEVLKQNHKFLSLKDIIYFDLQVIDEKKEFVKEYPDKLSFSFFVKDTLPHPATFLKAVLFNKIGLYDENLKIVSDWKFLLESVCKFNCSYERINQILSTFYLDGLSSNFQNKKLILEERQHVLETNFSIYLDDIIELRNLESTVSNLRKSRKIKILIKLGLLNKF